MSVQLSTLGATIKTALTALVEGSRLALSAINPGPERSIMVVNKLSVETLNERYAVRPMIDEDTGTMVFDLDPGDSVEITEKVVSGFDVVSDETVAVQFNDQDLHDFLHGARGELEVTASGSFTLAVEPWHTAIKLTLTANSTLTALTGLLPGQGIMLFVVNSASYTLAESSSSIYTIGSDALTLTGSITNWLYLQADPTGKVGIRNLGITSAS